MKSQIFAAFALLAAVPAFAALTDGEKKAIEDAVYANEEVQKVLPAILPIVGEDGIGQSYQANLKIERKSSTLVVGVLKTQVLKVNKNQEVVEEGKPVCRDLEITGPSKEADSKKLKVEIVSEAKDC